MVTCTDLRRIGQPGQYPTHIAFMDHLWRDNFEDNRVTQVTGAFNSFLSAMGQDMLRVRDSIFFEKFHGIGFEQEPGAAVFNVSMNTRLMDRRHHTSFNQDCGGYFRLTAHRRVALAKLGCPHIGCDALNGSFGGMKNRYARGQQFNHEVFSSTPSTKISHGDVTLRTGPETFDHFHRTWNRIRKDN